MNGYAAGIRQHDTHRQLADRRASTSRADAPRLDAIIVPGTRPAAYLDHAVTLARAAGCWLVILCSQQLRGTDVKEFLAARSFRRAIVVDLPSGYSHDLLTFPGLLSLKDDLPRECGWYVTDLSMKRNIGLVLARMLEWQRVFFLDDDIRDITYPDLRSTVSMLGSFSAASMWVTDFPDNSIVCHANRMTGASQDVFVSGAALAVDWFGDIGFFPDIYNEDWLFFYDAASKGRLGNSYLSATQLLLLSVRESASEPHGRNSVTSSRKDCMHFCILGGMCGRQTMYTGNPSSVRGRISLKAFSPVRKMPPQICRRRLSHRWSRH